MKTFLLAIIAASVATLATLALTQHNAAADMQQRAAYALVAESL